MFSLQFIKLHLPLLDFARDLSQFRQTTGNVEHSKMVCLNLQLLQITSIKLRCEDSLLFMCSSLLI